MRKKSSPWSHLEFGLIVTSSAMDKMFEIFRPIFEQNANCKFRTYFWTNCKFWSCFRKKCIHFSISVKSVNFEHFVNGRWSHFKTKSSLILGRRNLYLSLKWQRSEGKNRRLDFTLRKDQWPPRWARIYVGTLIDPPYLPLPLDPPSEAPFRFYRLEFDN